MLPIDLIDQTSIIAALKKAEPDEVIILAAQSFVGVSFDEAIATGEGLGSWRDAHTRRHSFLLIRALSLFRPRHQNCTVTRRLPQSEITPFHPQSPYAAAKLYAHWVTNNYRTGYGLFASCGILF